MMSYNILEMLNLEFISILLEQVNSSKTPIERDNSYRTVFIEDDIETERSISEITDRDLKPMAIYLADKNNISGKDILTSVPIIPLMMDANVTTYKGLTCIVYQDKVTRKYRFQITYKTV